MLREGLIGTLIKIFQNIFKAQVRFMRPFIKCCEVFCIFSKSQPDGLIDEIGNGSIRLYRFDSQRLVEIRIEVDCGSLLGCLHGIIVTFTRPDVNIKSYCVSRHSKRFSAFMVITTSRRWFSTSMYE